MYIEEKGKKLFDKNLYGDKNISITGIREGENLLEANNDLGEENLDDYMCLKEDAIFELNRIGKIIIVYPNVLSIYNEVRSFVLDYNEDAVSIETMAEIIRLQAAVGLEINLKYINAIELAFNDIYMDIVNGHYEDRYKSDKPKVKCLNLF